MMGHLGRSAGAFSAATLGGWAGGFFSYEHMLQPTTVREGVIAVFLTAAIAGMIRGSTHQAKAAFVFPFLIFAGVLAAGTYALLHLRGWLVVVELLVPWALAVAVFWWPYRWTVRRQDR